MGTFKNFIIGTLGVAVICGATALAIPQSRNFVLDKIAGQSQIYKTAIGNNSKLEQENKDLQDTSTAQAEALAKLKIDLETKSTALTKCQGDLEKVTGKKTELETTLASKEIEIQNLTQEKSDLTTQLTTATSEKETLQTQLTTANSEKSKLETTVTNLTSQLAEKQSQIDSLTSQLATKQSELDQANSDKQSLQSQLDSANAQISTLQSQISTLETEKADLQKQVDDLKASVDVVVTKKPILNFQTLCIDPPNFLFSIYNKESNSKCKVDYFTSLFNKDLLGLDIDPGYTYYLSGPNFSFDSEQVFFDPSYKRVNNLHMRFYLGTEEDNSFLGENLDFLDCVLKSSYLYWNNFNYNFELSEDGSKFNDFTINFFLSQLTLDNTKATYTYKSSTSDRTISIFSGMNCIAINQGVVNAYTLADGIYTVHSYFDHSTLFTIDTSNPNSFVYGGETYTLVEPAVTADNIECKIGGTYNDNLDYMSITYTSTTKHCRIGINGSSDKPAYDIVFKSYENGVLTFTRTDTQDDIVVSGTRMHYDFSTQKYVLEEGTVNNHSLDSTAYAD